MSVLDLAGSACSAPVAGSSLWSLLPK